MMIKKLTDSKLLTRDAIEGVLGTKLVLSKSKSNQYFNIYKAKNGSIGWKTAEVRIPKALGGTIIILEIKSNVATTHDVITFFGHPSSPLQPHIIPDGPLTKETIMKYLVSDKTTSWIFSDTGELKSLIINDGR